MFSRKVKKPVMGFYASEKENPGQIYLADLRTGKKTILNIDGCMAMGRSRPRDVVKVGPENQVGPE